MGSFATKILAKGSDLLFSGNRATIDAIRMAPPPSPLAPVDLTDPNQVQDVMDLAARIGDLLLAAGTGNSDARAHIHAITTAYGLYYTHVDITLNTITVYARVTDDTPPVNVFRVVHKLSTDYSHLTELDRLIRSIVRGAAPLDEARAILTEIEQSPLPFRNRYALLAWGGFAGAVSLLLGGGWAVAVVATITTLFIMTLNAWLASKSLPMFFQNVLGGFMAVIPAAICYPLAQMSGLYLPPSLVIASCIVALLAGLQLVQTIQDGVTGAPITASARFFETILMTGGIIAGIAVGIQAVDHIGVSLPPLNTSQTSGILGTTAVQILSGAFATAFFCLANFCERRATLVAGTTALLASISFFFITDVLQLSLMMANTVCALAVGFAGGILSRRFLLPPQITAATGIVPFLPGLALYRGMSSLLNDEFIQGLSNLALALATATALAAGVVFGEWVARRVRRPHILHRAGRVLRPVIRPEGSRRQTRAFSPVYWRKGTKMGLRAPWAWRRSTDTSIYEVFEDTELDFNDSSSDSNAGDSERMSEG
ncbi:threonine/serine exporter ThrE [Corynebacterium zhongnanshanii]|uniref:threonine/serine exporter ThrE n=2 Tax=Corynebacterium TaxID=1716 RepID=UPI003CC823D8